MNAGREEGFTYPEEKGLFTFYREQTTETLPKTTNSKQEGKYSTDKQNRLPMLTPQREKSHPLSFIALTPHSVITNSPPPKSPRNSGQTCRIPKLALPINHSTKKQQLQSIVQLSFDLTTQEEKAQVNHKARARTEVSSNTPLGKSSPLKQVKQRQIHKKEQSVDYFSEKLHQRPTKMKHTIKLGSSKKILMDDRHIRQQNQNLIINHWSNHKPIRPVELLPQIQPQGSSISFWQYFQERKNVFLGRYKREKAGRYHNQQTHTRRLKTIKLSLTNNHI